MAIAEIAACISLVKGLNDAIATAKEAKNNAGAFANIIGKFAKANDAVLDAESKNISRMSIQDSMQIQVAKRQLSTFQQQLKDIMLMQGLSADYNEIMNRVEESRLAHEKAMHVLKLKKKQRKKDLHLLLQILGYALLTVSVFVIIAWVFSGT